MTTGFKSGWERVKPVVEISSQDIHTIWESYFPNDKLQHYSILSGGLANTNYHCESTNGMKVVLRVFTRSEDACLREQTIHNLVAQDLPVAKILFVDTKKDIIPYFFSFLEWCEGVSLRDLIQQEADYLAPIFFELGYALHYLQKHRFSEQGELDSNLKITPFSEGVDNPFLDYTLQCLQSQESKKNLGEKLCSQLSKFVKNNQHLYETIHQKFHLVHADYDPANILICTENKKVAAILDWEFSYSGVIFSDLANMLRYQHLLEKSHIHHFLKGIEESGIILPKQWLTMVKLIDLPALLGFVQSMDDYPKRYADIRKLLSLTLEIS